MKQDRVLFGLMCSEKRIAYYSMHVSQTVRSNLTPTVEATGTGMTHEDRLCHVPQHFFEVERRPEANSLPLIIPRRVQNFAPRLFISPLRPRHGSRRAACVIDDVPPGIAFVLLKDTVGQLLQ